MFLVTKATWEWKPLKDLSILNAFMYCRAALWKHLGQSSGHLGQWLTSLDLKDPCFYLGTHPANRHSIRFCQNGTAWQFTVLSCGLSISPRVFTKILKPVLACAKNIHLHEVKLHICNWATHRIIIIELHVIEIQIEESIVSH